MQKKKKQDEGRLTLRAMDNSVLVQVIQWYTTVASCLIQISVLSALKETCGLHFQ